MTRENEIWKDIEGYEGLYQVSTLGRLKRLEYIVICKNGRNRKLPTHILNPPILKNGYIIACLRKEGKGKYLLLHRLVASAFLPNPNNLAQVNHKDGNKKNNNVENLEWVTPQNNIIHAFNNNLMHPAHGIKINVGHFVEEDIRNIRLKASEGMSQRKIAAEYGVKQNAIWLILNCKTYKWVK
jgi:hypothetical protein